MNTILDKHGTLIIETQSPIEQFALSHWYSMWQKGEVTFLIRVDEKADKEIKPK